MVIYIILKLLQLNQLLIVWQNTIKKDIQILSLLVVWITIRLHIIQIVVTFQSAILKMSSVLLIFKMAYKPYILVELSSTPSLVKSYHHGNHVWDSFERLLKTITFHTSLSRQLIQFAKIMGILLVKFINAQFVVKKPKFIPVLLVTIDQLRIGMLVRLKNLLNVENIV